MKKLIIRLINYVSVINIGIYPNSYYYSKNSGITYKVIDISATKINYVVCEYVKRTKIGKTTIGGKYIKAELNANFIKCLIINHKLNEKS